MSVCEVAAFDGPYNLRLHPTRVGPLTRASAFPGSGGTVTSPGAGEPDRYTDGAQLVFSRVLGVARTLGPNARNQLSRIG